LRGYLLDTSVVLDVADRPEALSRAARTALEHGTMYLSVISYWEVVIKSAKGKLIVGDPRRWWHLTITKTEAGVLTFRPEHVSAITDLPPIHNDPFDRALIAQATVENLAFITSDRTIPQYASDRFSVVV
jgi:PIN domain nuclease of toxin-antitoxin system